MPNLLDFSKYRWMVFVPKVRWTDKHFECIFWVPSVQKENSDLQSTVWTSDPWQKGSAFSAGTVAEVQRNCSSVSISGIWQRETPSAFSVPLTACRWLPPSGASASYLISGYFPCCVLKRFLLQLSFYKPTIVAVIMFGDINRCAWC